MRCFSVRIARVALFGAGAAAALASALAATSCRPKSADSNGSNPPDGGGPLASLYATDPQLSYWTFGDTWEALALAYTDESGLYDADTNANKLVPNAKKSATGASYSLDRGKTWQRTPTVPTQDASCAFPSCVLAFAGSPSLAPREISRNFVLASLGYTRTDVSEPDAVVIATTHDFKSWDPPRVAVRIDGRPPSGFSLGRRNTQSVIAMTDRVKGWLYTASATYEPPDFHNAELLPISPDADQLTYKDSPILQLATAAEGWIAYVVPKNTQGTTFDVRILHLFREQDIYGNVTPWQSSTIFKLDGVRVDASVPGALGRTWRDARPIAFAVANVSKHIYLALRQRSTTTGRSEIFLVHCDSSAEQDCVVDENGANTPGWKVQRFDTAYSGGQFQPTLVAERASDAVGLTWLQQTRDGSAEVRVMGVSSVDQAIHFTAPRELGPAWSVCPTAGTVADGVHYFASRGSSSMLSFYPVTDSKPTFFTAHADSSGGCDARGELTFDLHVGVDTW